MPRNDTTPTRTDDHPSPASTTRARRQLLRAVARRTRGHVARQGLHVRPGTRPTRTRRRRILASATSTSLTAPLFVLDGVPPALLDPVGPDWDALGPGSVVAASDVVLAAPPVDGLSATAAAETADRLLAIASPETDLRRRATPWVRAAGVPGIGLATNAEIRQAETALGLSLGSDEPGEATIERLRQAALQPAEDVTRALGLVEGDTPVRPADVLAAADALGVPAPRGVTPELVDAVVAAGAPVVAAHLGDTVTPYARALGLDVGDTVDAADTAAVAAELGLELPGVPGASDAERLHTAWLQTLAPHFARFGLDAGQSVDPVDAVALAHALGADVDSGVGPAELTALLEAYEARIGQAVPYGRVGNATLHLPSQHVVRAGWHQASGSIALPHEDLGAEAVFELPSRGRGTDARSAMDVAVEPGTPALSPVSGTVVEAAQYSLYGKYPDTQIRIRPDADPSLVVSVLHVTGAQVTVGDHVEAGQQIAAHATQFPFASQIDEFVGRLPHIHVEVKHA